ncbi:MAG: hypothetical protein A2Y12_17495 [Planctomycetes bacterium GWF2_42_9]|nr:MAG: hypothetical protein A2Y12_17495 [Planctomycetes bacterium GWF2_42_9]HAL45013.1 hypothetical protein [Phycisphaerales bacterium]
MIAELIVFAAIVITMGYLYLKGSIVKSFTFFMCALIASVVALSFFEALGRVLMAYTIDYIGQWAFTIALILTFFIVFIVLLIISEKLEPFELYFGDLGDRVGRCILAIPSALIFAGVLLIAVNLSPLASKWPYQRFAIENKNARPDQPDKSLVLNADGFTTGFSFIISKGSMAGKKSLAVFHPQLLNELALNRTISDESSSIIAGNEALTVSKAYYASEKFAETLKNRVPGSKTVILETELRNSQIKDGGALLVVENGTVSYTMGQVRLICTETPDNLKGQGETVYPIGYFKDDGSVEEKPLLEEIKLTGGDFPTGSKKINFIFNVPSGKTPVMLQFKLNSVAEISRVRKAEELADPNQQNG